MVNMSEVIERIKDVISKDYPDSKVLDKNVAYALGITPDNLSTKKSRNLIPYDELTIFCIERKVSTNWLFFGIGKQVMNYG